MNAPVSAPDRMILLIIRIMTYCTLAPPLLRLCSLCGHCAVEPASAHILLGTDLAVRGASASASAFLRLLETQHTYASLCVRARIIDQLAEQGGGGRGGLNR